MAFWNKSKMRDETNPAAPIDDLSNPIDPELEDDLDDLPEDDLPEEVEQDAPEEDIMEVGRMPDSDLCTSISRNAEIIGNIITADNLEVYGSIDGDITSEALVKIYGTVTGQIQCDTLIASGAKITGDITCQELIEVRANTDIEGDILCNAAIISGNLQGNINAEQTASLSGTAVVEGNITTPEFEVAKGAILNGTISINRNIPVAPPVEQVVEPKPQPIIVVEQEPVEETIEEVESDTIDEGDILQID